MSKTVEMLKNYKPSCEQEEKDLLQIIKAEEVFGDILTRENSFCHMTASAFVINKKHTKVLCIYHNVYNSWCWIGGHADGDDNMLYVAKKETKEETSLQNFSEILKTPISVEVLPVISHVKRGRFIPAHLHFNVTYLFEADEKDTVHILESENSNVGWLTFDELVTKSTEPHMVCVYKKIIDKIKNL